MGWLKANHDAAFKGRNEALGLVVRNELGEVVLLFFKLLKCASALEADMKAILWATKAVKNEEWLNVL